MGIKYLLTLLCIVLPVSVQASDYSYNTPSRNQQVQNVFSEYMESVRYSLQKNWATPDFLENGHVRVLFKLDKDGNVIQGDILESSGNPVYDESVVDAIHKSEPFGKFPENSTRQTLTINYTFDVSTIDTERAKRYIDICNQNFWNDKQTALKYLDLAIKEIEGNPNSYFLYKKRAKLKEAMGDHVGARQDLIEYNNKKNIADIRRVHEIKHRAEVEDSAFAYYYLAYAYEQIKDYENAIHAINKAIERTDLNQQYKRYRTELIRIQDIESSI